MLVGYARINETEERSELERQVRLLRSEGCEKVFAEQVSYGRVGRMRPELDNAIRSVRRGDCLVAVKADRIARSVEDLQWIISELAARGISFRIIGNFGNELDTRSPVAQSMIAMLSFIVDFERNVLLERKRELERNAPAKRSCRRSEPIAQHQSDEILRLFAEGMAKAAIAVKIGVSLSSVYRIVGMSR